MRYVFCLLMLHYLFSDIKNFHGSLRTAEKPVLCTHTSESNSKEEEVSDNYCDSVCSLCLMMPVYVIFLARKLHRLA